MQKRAVKRRVGTQSDVHSPSISKILQVDSQTKNWLVEWTDFSRSWESYENIKDTIVFREYVERLAPRYLQEATYIS
jgi:hypothetical protein